jgi:MFS transporter, PAT family, beta-lactamase induction signal transducer AmpG
MDQMRIGYHVHPMLESRLNLNLTDRPLLRLLTLCILYVAQGIPYGFVTVTFASYLAERGETVAAIGAVTALSTLPWTFKWLWGPLIDRFGIPSMGRRRPWILAAQLGMTLSILVMALVPEPTAHLALIGWLVFVHNIFNSLQDVSVDALAVDLLRESERGRVNGFMYGSKYIGMFLGGAFLSRMVSVDGLGIAFTIQIFMLGGIMLFPLLLRERAGEKLLPWTKGSSQLSLDQQMAHSIMQLFGFLKRAFSLRSTLLAGAIGLTIFIAGGILSPITNVLFIQDLGWTRTEFTDINGGYGVFLGLAGAIAGGFLADRFGPKKIASIGCVVLALSYATFGLSSPDSGVLWFDWTNRPVVITYILVDTWMGSMISASLFAMYMTVSWPKVAATQFTVYMAILNMSTVIGLKSSGMISEMFTLPMIFVGAGILQVVVLGIFPFIDVHQARRVLST